MCALVLELPAFLPTSSRESERVRTEKTLKVIHTCSPRVNTVDQTAADPKEIDELKAAKELLKQVKQSRFFTTKAFKTKKIIQRFDSIQLDSIAQTPVRLEHIYLEVTQVN